MKICLLLSQSDADLPKLRGISLGMMSHVAEGENLRVRKNLPLDTADILVISAATPSREIARALSHEAARLHARGVLLDCATPPDEELALTLSERGITVFAPFSDNLPTSCTPVFEASVSGGNLADYFESIRSRIPNFAVSVRLSAHEFPLPFENGSDFPLSPQARRRLISRFSPDVFFSPQLSFKYFMYEPSPERVNLVLFDDAETVSQKLRLAKKHGASHAFLVWDEVSDIFDEIFF